jgi:hypothetical protein
LADKAGIKTLYYPQNYLLLLAKNIKKQFKNFVKINYTQKNNMNENNLCTQELEGNLVVRDFLITASNGENDDNKNSKTLLNREKQMPSTTK